MAQPPNVVGFKTPPPIRPAEAADQLQARLEREIRLVAQAEADIAAGLGVEWEDLEDWLHELDRDESAPAPEGPGSARSHGG